MNETAPETNEKEAEMKPEAAENAAAVEAEQKTETPADAPAEDQGAVVEDAEKIAAEEEAAKAKAEEEALAAEEVKIPDLRPGLTIRIHQKIKEGDKERVQVFQGIIIALRGKTPETKTVTVRKNSFGVNVEKIFPLGSPLIEKIELVKKARVRHSKLYFLRNYTKRLKEELIRD